ncbi:MAG: helix-turn-helix domain-containing protein [Thermoplasmatales archaeon]|nr:helix-turn-helix domain-containing protein [Thermoplasmatales archaeon]
MQTVTLEFPTEHLIALGLIPPRFFDRYEEVELLETLRLERGWRLQLVRVRRRGPLRSAHQAYGLTSFELLERRPRTRDYILLVRQRNPESLRALVGLAGGQIAPTAPFRMTPATVIASFHGEERALRRVLRRLRQMEFPFRIVRASHRPFHDTEQPADPTELQSELIARAWVLGYYAVPRRITLSRLARLTGRSAPALGKILRRAEGRLVARFLTGRVPFAPADAEGRPSGPTA